MASSNDCITLGWEVDNAFEPKYPKKAGATHGGQDDDDIVSIGRKGLRHHTVLIAQSGSGKSFVMGRLLEELVLKTRATIVVLDPNGDYIKFNKARATWDGDVYDKEAHEGACHTEPSPELFVKLWPQQSIRICRKAELKFSLDQINQAMLDSSSYFEAADLQNCHAFATAFCHLIRSYGGKTVLSKPEELLSALKIVRELSVSQDYDSLKTYLEQAFLKEYNAEKSKVRSANAQDTSTLAKIKKLLDNLQRTNFQRKTTALGGLLQRLVRLAKSLDDAAFRVYLNRLYYLLDEGLLCGAHAAEHTGEGAEIIDLPAFNESVRLTVVESVLRRAWDEARLRWDAALQSDRKNDKRTPTFIVCDEAHNLAPAGEAQGERAILRETFRRIAAEGRKLGVFLILVSQRPDKLDPLVLSECENKMLMRLGSEEVVDLTGTALGLTQEEKSEAKKCVQFRKGRGLLLGPWASPPDGPETRVRFFYSAGRRTEEGGRDLPDDWFKANWNEPEEDEVEEVEEVEE